jgi:serine/threonine-protein kinase
MPDDLVGTVLDGKFQIERALASGAAGDVYEAMHLGLSTPVAVKVLRPGHPETADIRRKRFMREARVAARLKSDNVVRVYDIVANTEGATYIVMELLQGETLAERLKRRGALSVPEAVDFVLQAAKPLAEMHDEGIVHRDVKPSNLFLARDADGKERIKLLDFGVAAFQQPVARSDSSITFSAAVLGTPRYMAPEQVLEASRVDARADVWALGVTLYELLAGRAPFDAQTVLAVLNQIEHSEPPRLRDVRPSIPPALADLVHECLTKDPRARPASARVLVDRLTSANRVVAAPRRDRRKLIAVAAAGVLLAGVLIVALRRAPEDPAQAALTPVTAAPPPPLPAAPPAPSPPTPPPAPLPTPAALPPAPSTPTATSHPPPSQRRTTSKPAAPPRPGRPAGRSSEDDDRIE